MKIDINYEDAIDFEHCKNIDDARTRLSTLTNLINKIIKVRQFAKTNILEECARFPAENMHKLSWDNKIIRLLSVCEYEQSIVDFISLYNQSEEAYRVVKNKQQQVLEDIMALKKMIDVTPQ